MPLSLLSQAQVRKWRSQGSFLLCQMLGPQFIALCLNRPDFYDLDHWGNSQTIFSLQHEISNEIEQNRKNIKTIDEDIQYLYLLEYFETRAKVDLLSKLILLLFIISSSCSNFSLLICFTFSICWILSKILFVELVASFLPNDGNCEFLVIGLPERELAPVLLPYVKFFFPKFIFLARSCELTLN